jgi:hypothetical protein
MITIITFLAGFYLGIIAFSLLVMARRNINNQYLVKPVIIHHFRKADPMIRQHGARSINRSINHDFREVENIL